MRRALKIIAIVVGSLFVLVAIASIVLLRSNFAREKVRGMLESTIAGIIDGEIRIGAARGGLLGDLTLIDVTIKDAQGQPFIAVDTVRASYDLWQLLHRRFVLGDVLLVRPVVLLDQRTGEQWNYARIFRVQADTTQGDTTANNLVVRLDRVRLVNGDITLRSSWRPDSTLTAAQRENSIARALSDSNLLRVQRVDGTYQMVQEYTGIYAFLPTVRIVDPGQTTMLVLIDSLSGNAQAFRGDPMTIRQASGEVEIAQDSLVFRGMHMRLPGSLLRAEGIYGLRTRSIAARVLADSISGSDARRFYSAIPEALRGSFALNLDVTEKESHYLLRDMNVSVGEATVQGMLDVTFKGGSISESLVDADLRISQLGSALVSEMVPGINLHAQGKLSGRVITKGPLRASQVAVDVTFDDRLSGRSIVSLRGGLGLGNKVALNNLAVTMSPAQIAIVRNYAPDFPIAGTATGTAMLNGVIGDSVASVLDLDLVTEGRTSRLDGKLSVVGTVNPVLRGDLRAGPLDLSIANAFVANGRFRGDAQGSITFDGPLSALNVGADLSIRNGGTVVLEGLLDLASDTLKYSATLTTEQLNLATVLADMETTSLNSVTTAQGRGVDPASLVASLDIVLRPSRYRDAELDSARFNGTLSGGVLLVDSLNAHLDGAIAVANGSLGITDSTTGVLQLRLFVDSLSKLSRWIPGDSVKFAPRPSRIAEAYRRARADSARIARETEIQRLIEGLPPPRLNVKVPPVIPADSLAGSALFVGQISGNTKRLTAQGELAASRIVAMGMTVDTVHATVTATILPGDSVAVNAQLRASTATAAGFEIDTAIATIAWSGKGAAVTAEVRQGAEERYEARFDFLRSGDSTVVNLAEARFHFDSATTWQTLHPARVVVSREAITVDSLDVRVGGTGSIHASGRLARSGGIGNIEVAAYGIEVSHLFDVMQSDMDISGVFSGGLTFTGNLNNPVFKGAAGFVDGVVGLRPLPELHAIFNYATGTLKTDVTASRKLGEAFAKGTAEIPLDLGTVPGVRAVDRPIRADFTLDSLPLELVPDVVQNVSNMAGDLRGEVHIAGTFNKPEVNGDFTIVDGAAYLNTIGVRLQHIAAQIDMEDDTVVIKDFTAQSGGLVRLEGGIGLAKLNEPSFDLHLVANNAYILNGELGRLRAYMDVNMYGPFLGASVEGYVGIRSGVVYLPDYSTKTVLAPNDSLFLVVLDTTNERSRLIYQEPNPFMENLVVNIDLGVDRGTWARSADANIEIFSDDILKIGLKRANRSLSLDGVLSTEQGQYTFLGKRFEIKRGSATFVGTENEINPNLQITGDHEVQLPGTGIVNISVVIGGTMARPRISLSSDAQPPLSQSDMFSYLAFGHSSGSLLQIGASTLAPGGGLQGLGRVAGQQLPGIALGVLMDEVERAAEGSGMRRLGLDFLNIVPAETYTEIVTGDVFGFLRQTSFEVGRYVTRQTYVAGQLRLSATPGIRAVHRSLNGYRLEMSWEPRQVLLEPTLSEQRSVTKRSFGLFLVREWRF